MNAQIVRIGDDIVAFHAVVTDVGVTLIDAGLPADLKALAGALAQHGRSVSDVVGIVLTHGDSDHIGIAEELRAEHGVRVFVHEADADRARGGKKPKVSAGGFSLGPALTFFWRALRRGGLRAKYLSEVETFASGETLPLPGSPEIIGMPGHSPGSVAVRISEAGALFLGDAVTTRHVMTGAEGVAPAPFTDDPATAAASLQALRDLPETRIFPGHGPEFTGTMRELLGHLTQPR